ncbi:DUF2326 domain-containing protein [Enterococcus mundtii]|uniref:DUF2326 domain-containing protein n=1 Tax=Enterococcus mundtii TaxID=53346 RepID=UPI000E076AD4|nr:DUF2326 domain-containing protein [Enterococcus mundtii]STD27408.1 Uncharacterized protein conserved in bacteria (DUF2326) [Enterococcus mundtii]
MFIEKMVISESSPVYKEIRTITFKKGMNFIVDGSDEEGEKGNSLGKTTVLRVIDICLGSRDKRYLYYDDELKNTNTVLEKYITANRVYAELILSDDLENPQVSHSLKVELFPRGKRFINNEPKNETEYYKRLNEILFNNYAEKPTFRQLIGMFVRIGQKEDNNRFLKFINYNISAEIYENIYSFLFRLDDSVRSEQILLLKNEIKSISNDIDKFKTFHSIKNENILKQKLLSINSDIEIVTNKTNQLMSAEIYKENEQKIQQIRIDYTNMIDELDDKEFKLSKIKSNLNKAKQEKEMQIDTSVLKNLYEETEQNLGKLNKTFLELVQFNESIVKNKIDFYEEQISKYGLKIHEIEEKISNYFDRNQGVIMLIENNQLEEYQDLESKREKLIEERGRLLEVSEKYDALVADLEEKEKKLEDIPENSTDIDTIITDFNEYFRDYSEKIIQEKFILYPTGQTFPIGVSNDETGLSTGTKKSAIAAFDLAYQMFSKDKGIVRPDFIVHDVLETMDKVSLDNIIKITNNIGCQYITAILSDKLSISSEYKQEDIRLTLTSDSKFFKV